MLEKLDNGNKPLKISRFKVFLFKNRKVIIPCIKWGFIIFVFVILKACI